MRDVVRTDGEQEIAGDELCALVDELVEGVLAVGAGLTPGNGARLVVDLVALAVNKLAVRLHIALLEVGREPVHVLVVGQDRVAVRTVEVVVPEGEEKLGVLGGRVC